MEELELKKVCDDILLIAETINATPNEISERNEDNAHVPSLPPREPGEQFQIRIGREHGKAWIARVVRPMMRGAALTIAKSLLATDPASALLSLLEVMKDDLRGRRDAATKFI